MRSGHNRKPRCTGMYAACNPDDKPRQMGGIAVSDWSKGISDGRSVALTVGKIPQSLIICNDIGTQAICSSSSVILVDVERDGDGRSSKPERE